MVDDQLESSTRVPLLLLTFILGMYCVMASDVMEKCSLISNVLDCSNRGFETVPQLEDINASFPLKFNLSYNHISIDTGDVFKFIKRWPGPDLYVSELYLDHNRIRYLPPETLNTFLRAKIVDLSWNQMETVSNKLFSSLLELERLSLAGNPITELDITLPSTVQELDVSSCNLSSLGPRMFAGLHLKSLDISNNSLAAVDWSQLDSETSVRMDGNPWDCGLLWESKPEMARLQERCTTTTGPATTTTAAAEAVEEESAPTTTEKVQSEGPAPPEEVLWSSFGIVEGVLVGWLVYFLLLGSAAWLRARSLERDLARGGNWWLEPRM